ncbi:peptidyl-prolyl cis-trans isomerase [Brucella sp. NM4]|uniref:peptidyl-prolyl cis-trans isomerase n=1 Tax=Brucella/Ochrobactrum group TaxID=2826938 RepID=UPI0024BC74FB|nr:peptidyl-prolyl cis-trans isomerase [Brucella sp. NM4]WHS31112.1 peptidyl-prolyl cis-trans isomerase [Brucella sp. NM4]WHT42438.1 peptidyl-prolyl cis-trans isomerase [Ochrobactrum sp. SSR]
MLDSLRSASRSWISKLLLGVLVLSFGVWGIADVFRGGMTGNAALTAGDSEVSATDYRFAYEQQVMRLSQQFRQRLTREQAKSIGVENQVLAQLAAGVVLDEGARKMQLGLSKDGIARLTAEDPAFQDASGNFNRAQFDAVLRQSGIRAQDYLDNRAKVARRQQMVEAATDGIKMPDAMLKALALYQGESRSADYITIPVEKADAIPAPSDEVLKTYFDAQKDEYKAPEYRKVTYVKLEPADIADPSAVTQDEINEYYEKNKSRYGTIEQRTIEQLSFADEAAANAAQEKIAAGASFLDIGKEQGKTEDDLKLGTFEKSAIPDQTIADAAFALAENGVSPVVKGGFGPVILRVTKIDPAHVKPLSEVEAEIRTTLANNIAASSISGIHDSYEQQRSDGASMADVAKSLSLKTVTVDAVDAEGNDPSGKPVELPNGQALLAAAFQAEQGFDNDALTMGNVGYLWYQIDGVTPARDRTLDEVKDKVVAAWKGEEAVKRLNQRLEDLKKRLDGGATLDAIASELGLEKQTKRGITRSTNDADIGSAAAAQIFRGPDGFTGTAAAPSDDAQILFKVTEVTEPASAGPDTIPEQQRNYLATALSDDVLEQMVGELQKQYPVKINQTVINNALAF